MIDRETAEELANLYDQLRYNLEHFKSFLATIDAAVRTMLQFQELAEPFQHNLTDGQLLPHTRALDEQLALMLAATRAKASDLRSIALPDIGPLN